MTKRRSSLTGSWSGAFAYAIGGHETVFNAQIEEQDGAFAGATEEPNEFLDTLDAILHAEIAGYRQGSTVTFVKRYTHTHREARHAIRYEGVANTELTRIEGHWSVSSDWSGTFVMIREDDAVAVEQDTLAEVETAS